MYLLGGRNRVATLINLSWRYIAWGHGGGVIVGDEPTVPLHGETGQAAERESLPQGPTTSRSNASRVASSAKAGDAEPLVRRRR